MTVVRRWRLVPVAQHGSKHMRVEGPATDEPVEVCAVPEPAESQALADLEAAARDAVEAMCGPGLVDEQTARDRLRGALAALDAARRADGR